MNNIEQIEKDIYKYTMGRNKVECVYIKECNYSKEKGYCMYACSNYKASIKELATALDKKGYRKQSETVKEFADKVIDVIFSHSGIAQDCSKVLASPEILQDEINDLAAEFGKEK